MYRMSSPVSRFRSMGFLRTGTLAWNLKDVSNQDFQKELYTALEAKDEEKNEAEPSTDKTDSADSINETEDKS